MPTNLYNPAQDEEEEDQPIQIAENPGIFKSLSNLLVPEAGAAELKSKANKKTPTKQKLPSTEQIREFIIDEARRRGKDPALVLAHFEKESSLNPKAFNKGGGGKGARGLTQVREPAFTDAKKYDKSGALKNLKFEDMSDPERWKENVIAGLNYYDVANRYWKPKSTEEFLKSYNQGSPTGKGFKSKEAQEYADDVMARYARQKEYIDSLDSSRALSTMDAQRGEPLAQQPNFPNLIKRLRK